MTRNKDSRILTNSDVDFCDLRISVSRCIRFIQKLHHFDSVASCFQGQRCQIIRTQGIIKCRRKCPLEKSIDFRVCMKQCRSVFRISSKPFQPVSDQFTKASDILILCRKHAHLSCLRFIFAFHSIPERGLRERVTVRHFPKQLLLNFKCFFDSPDDRILIKICICDRCKKIHDNLLIYRVLDLFSLRAKFCGHCT